MANYRALTPEEREIARTAGVTLPDNAVYDVDNRQAVVLEPNSAPRSDQMPQGQPEVAPKKPGGIMSIGDDFVNDTPVLGTVKRQVTANALPAAVGGVVTGATAPFIGPFSVIPGAAAGAGARWLQDKLMGSYAEKNPESPTAINFKRTQQEEQEHPYLSAIASAPAAGFGGGSFMPNMKDLTLGRAAKIAGLTGGVNAGMQLAQNGGDITKLNVPQLLTGAVAGVPFSNPGKLASLTIAPGELAKGPSRQDTVKKTLGGDKEYQAATGQSPDAIDQLMLPANKRSSYNYDWMWSTDPKNLQLLKKDPFYRTIAKLRSSGIKLTPEQVDVLASRGYGEGFDRVAGELAMKGMQEADAKAASQAEEQARARSVEAQKTDAIAPVKAPKVPVAPVPEKPSAPVVPPVETPKPPVTPEPPVILKPKPEPLADALRQLNEQDAAKVLEKPTEKPKVDTGLTPEQEAEIQGELQDELSGATKATPKVEPQAVPQAVEPQIAPVEPAKPKGFKRTKVTEVEAGTKIPWAGSTAEKQGDGSWLLANGEKATAAVKAQLEKKALGSAKKAMLGPNANPEAIIGGKAQGGFLNIPQAVQEKVQSVVDSAKSILRPPTSFLKDSPLGKYVANKYEVAQQKQRALENPSQEALNIASKGLSKAERTNVGKAIKDLFYTGKTNVKLTPNEQDSFDALKRIYREWTLYRAMPNAPYVSAWVNGQMVQRPGQITPNWARMELAPEYRNALSNAANNPNAFAKVKKSFIDYYTKRHGLSPKYAEDTFNAQFAKPVSAPGVSPEMGALRIQEGLGIPPELADPDPFRAMKHYVTKSSRDLAYHREVESDPVVAKAMGLKDNGRGVAIPDVVIGPDGKPVEPGALGSHLKDIMRDYAGATIPGAQKLEGITHGLTASIVGPVSQLRDIVSSLPAISEMVKPSEVHLVAKGLVDIFRPSAREAALKSGSLRAARQLSPALSGDFSSGMASLGDVISKYTGTEAISQAQRVFGDSIGRGAAKIHYGEPEFMKQWAPSDWASRPKAEVIDFIAAKMSDNLGSAYNATDLPSWLLRGQGNMLKPVYQLSRWSVGRANRFIDNAVKPAFQGNPAPLVRSVLAGLVSAEAINAINKAILNRKPKEMTLEELAKMKNVPPSELAYTIASKANTAALGGILSSLAFMGVQKASGESSYGANNVLIRAAQDTSDLVGDYITAVNNGDIHWTEGLPVLAGELLRRNSQVVNVLASQGTPDTGIREERMARRMGYMPKASIDGGVPNPFSEAGAYKREDTEQLSNIMQRKALSGMPVEAPRSDVRTSVAVKDGRPVTYYDLVEALGQDKDAAVKRDMASTFAKGKLQQEAARRMFERLHTAR